MVMRVRECGGDSAPRVRRRERTRVRSRRFNLKVRREDHDRRQAAGTAAYYLSLLFSTPESHAAGLPCAVDSESLTPLSR